MLISLIQMIWIFWNKLDDQDYATDNCENTYCCDKLGQQYLTWSVDLFFPHDSSANNCFIIIHEDIYVHFFD